MRKIFILIVSLASAYYGKAQTWLPLGNGADSVTALTIYNGSLIAGGYFDSAGGVAANSIAQWNGTTWQPLGSGLTYGGYVPQIYGLETYNNDLYVGGFFIDAGNYFSDHIAEWNGISWDSLSPYKTASCAVSCFTIYNNNLVLGGPFKFVSGTDSTSGIAGWNGSSYFSIGGGLNNTVNALTVYNGSLIAAGNFDSAGGIPVNGIAEWNGTSWEPLGKGISGAVFALIVYNGNLYAGGVFDSTAEIYNGLVEWNGLSWSSIGKNVREGGGNGMVTSLTINNGNLFIGGFFDSINGISASNVAQWNDSSWAALGNGTSGGIVGTNGVIYSLASYNGNLYAGGYFTAAGNNVTNGIAEWCNNCTAGINQVSKKNVQVNIYPNPNNGKFTVVLSGLSNFSHLEVYNMLGEKIYAQQFQYAETSNVIDLSNQPPGIYLYKVLSDNGDFIANGKIVIQ